MPGRKLCVAAPVAVRTAKEPEEPRHQQQRAAEALGDVHSEQGATPLYLRAASAPNTFTFTTFSAVTLPQESLIDKLSMKCGIGEKKRETLQAQLAAGSNDGEVFGTIDFDQLQIENSQLQEKIDNRNSELLALKQATAMTLTRLNALKLQLSQVLTETAWLKSQKGLKMGAIDKVAAACTPLPHKTTGNQFV